MIWSMEAYIYLNLTYIYIICKFQVVPLPVKNKYQQDLLQFVPNYQGTVTTTVNKNTAQ